MSRAEERRLAQAIQLGNKALTELEGPHRGDANGRRKLLAQADAGRQARDTLVVANLPFASWAAARWTRHARSIVDGDDSRSVSLIAMLRAAETYDGRVRFVEYVRYPCFGQIVKQSWHHGARVGRPSSADACRLLLQRSANPFSSWWDLPSASRLTPERVSHIARLHELGVAESLESFGAKDGDGTGIDSEGYARAEPHAAALVESRTHGEPDDRVNNQLDYKALVEALRTLRENRRVVLILKYLTDDPQTNAGVGKYLRLTPERIRQIEAMAICDLRHPKSGLWDAVSPDALPYSAAGVASPSFFELVDWRMLRRGVPRELSGVPMCLLEHPSAWRRGSMIISRRQLARVASVRREILQDAIDTLETPAALRRVGMEGADLALARSAALRDRSATEALTKAWFEPGPSRGEPAPFDSASIYAATSGFADRAVRCGFRENRRIEADDVISSELQRCCVAYVDLSRQIMRAAGVDSSMQIPLRMLLQCDSVSDRAAADIRRKIAQRWLTEWGVFASSDPPSGPAGSYTLADVIRLDWRAHLIASGVTELARYNSSAATTDELLSRDANAMAL